MKSVLLLIGVSCAIFGPAVGTLAILSVILTDNGTGLGHVVFACGGWLAGIFGVGLIFFSEAVDLLTQLVAAARSTGKPGTPKTPPVRVTD